MLEGWIKLHRQFKDSPYYKIGAASQTWIECLMRASHSDDIVFLKRQKVSLKSGQFCMGREEFGASIGISGSTAWYWLLQFEADGMIDIKKTTKGSIVSVKNWNEYQKVDSTSNNKKTADEQQMNTNKNVNNVKNEKKDIVDELRSPPPSQISRDFFTIETKREETISRLVEQGYEEGLVRAQIKLFVEYWTERNKSGTKQKWEMESTFEIPRRLKTWFRNYDTFNSPKTYAR